MVDLAKLNEELTRILARQDALSQRKRERRIAREKPRLLDYGLREGEAESWLSEEPDFDKPILKRQHDVDNSSSSDSGG